MLFLLSLRNLLRNPRRTMTVLVTVAVGTASLFIFHGFNTGIMNQYRDNMIHGLYGHGQLNTRGYRESVFEKPWEHWITNYSELEPKLLGIPGVKHLFPRMQLFALLSNGQITISGRGQGVDSVKESTFFDTMNVVEGKMLSDEVDGILLGIGLARALAVKVGDRVTVLANTVRGSINGLDLIVTGIFHTGMRELDNALFRVPIAQAKLLLDTERIESISIGLHSNDAWPGFAAAVSQIAPELETVPFAELDKVYYQNSVDWLQAQFNVIQGIILTIVLLGIFNTIATSILERKQEIGNLRANGESFLEVLMLLTGEGLALGLLGTLLGLGVALLLNFTVLANGILMPPAPGLTRQFHIMIELQASMAFRTVVMGLVTAAIGTLIAGWKAARMPIGDALRST